MKQTQELDTVESDHTGTAMDNYAGLDGATSVLPVNTWLLLQLNAAVLREQCCSDRRQIKCTSGMFG